MNIDLIIIHDFIFEVAVRTSEGKKQDMFYSL